MLQKYDKLGLSNAEPALAFLTDSRGREDEADPILYNLKRLPLPPLAGFEEAGIVMWPLGLRGHRHLASFATPDPSLKPAREIPTRAQTAWSMAGLQVAGC